jgi:hypothetical protein
MNIEAQKKKKKSPGLQMNEEITSIIESNMV